MIIVRCIGEKSFFVEKVIFPSEILTFDAPKGSRGLGGGGRIGSRGELDFGDPFALRKKPAE